MIKKTTLAVLGLAVSGFATAGTMGPVCAPGNVTVPCEAQAWDLGVQALYLKSAYTADRAYRPMLQASNTEVQNDWDWGYRLEGSYHFNTGNDATMTWMHYQSEANQGGFVGFFPVPPLFGSAYVLNRDNEFDQINLVLGQHVDVGLVKKMRFYGGLQWAHIRDNSTNFYASPAPLAPTITGLNQFDNADYKGYGPVIGIDYAYYLTSEFSLTANGSSSVLYGTSRVANGFVGTPANGVVAARAGKKRAVVPSLEAKLGLNYAYSMPMGTLNLEAGYQAVNYFNALQGGGSAGLLLIPGAPLGNFSESDFGMYGPYFGLKYVGNA